MKDFLGLLEYAFLVGVPGLAARELFARGCPVLGVFVVLFFIYTVLLRLTSANYKEDLKRTQTYLRTLEELYDQTRQTDRISYNLLNSEQRSEYHDIVEKRHLDKWIKYEYHLYEPIDYFPPKDE